MLPPVMLIFRIFEYLFRRRHSNTTATTVSSKNRDTRTETIITVVLDDCVDFVLIFTGAVWQVGASDEDREEGVDTEIEGCVEGFFVRLVVDFVVGFVVGIYLKKVQYIKLFQ